MSNKNVNLNIRVTPELKSSLLARAGALSLSSIARLLLERWLRGEIAISLTGPEPVVVETVPAETEVAHDEPTV